MCVPCEIVSNKIFNLTVKIKEINTMDIFSTYCFKVRENLLKAVDKLPKSGTSSVRQTANTLAKLSEKPDELSEDSQRTGSLVLRSLSQQFRSKLNDYTDENIKETGRLVTPFARSGSNMYYVTLLGVVGVFGRANQLRDRNGTVGWKGGRVILKIGQISVIQYVADPCLLKFILERVFHGIF